MKNFHLVLAITTLGLLVVLGFLLMPGSALAANRLPDRAISVRIVDPCWGCPTPTPDAPGGSREFAPAVNALSDIPSFRPIAPDANTPEACVLVEIKGPWGIRGLRCWNPSK